MTKFNWNKAASIVTVGAALIVILPFLAKAAGEGGESGGGGGGDMQIPFIGSLLGGSGAVGSSVQPETASGTVPIISLIQELALGSSFRDLGNGNYTGVRTLPSGDKKVVEGNIGSIGYAISPTTGQKYTPVSKTETLYTEKSRDMTPYEKISASRGINYITGSGTPAAATTAKKSSSSTPSFVKSHWSAARKAGY